MGLIKCDHIKRLIILTSDHIKLPVPDISDFQILFRGPVVIREISSSGPPIPTKSVFCASRSTKIFQVVREPEKFGNHCYTS